MAKSLFLLIIASLIGVVMNPGVLAASDMVALTGLDPTGVVETVPLPEPEPEPVVEPEPVAYAPYVPQVQNYNVTVYSDAIVAHNLSYGDIYKTGKMIYGHNTWNLLGSIKSLSYGEIFTVTEGGVTTNYQVANVIIYDKNVELGILQRNGQGSYMQAVMNGMDKDTRTYYDLTLFTCHGVSLGNGDATQRYVVFANAV